MSGGRSKRPGIALGVRYCKPPGIAVGIANGSRLHNAKPHTPNDGTAAWYGFTWNPAASYVRITHQNDVRANNGDVHWMLTAAVGLSNFCSFR